jgi:uncharacterized protein (DUF1697 family)
MFSYVAFLRGIAPMNPNMKNEKLKGVFEDLGFENIQTVISSGNVLFESPSSDVQSLEATIEEAWPKKLGFYSTTIVRNHDQIKRLVDENPFKGISADRNLYLNVTFLKSDPKTKLNYPYEPADKSWKLLGFYEGAVCSVTDLSKTRTPDLYTQLEKLFTKEITTRTWQTVNRILKKFEQ